MDKNDLKTLVIDLDGTLCTQEESGRYHYAKPIPDMIQKVNQLWTAGWRIVIFTARGMRTCNGDVAKVRALYHQVTTDWLFNNRVCYSELVFGKPPGDFYVDDKAITLEHFLKMDADGRCDN